MTKRQRLAWRGLNSACEALKAELLGRPEHAEGHARAAKVIARSLGVRLPSTNVVRTAGPKGKPILPVFQLLKGPEVKCFLRAARGVSRARMEALDAELEKHGQIDTKGMKPEERALLRADLYKSNPVVERMCREAASLTIRTRDAKAFRNRVMKMIEARGRR